MPLWYDNGGLIYQDSGLEYCDECPCTGTGSTGTSSGSGLGCQCEMCLDNLMPDYMRVTFPSISGGTCPSCAVYAAGTYNIPYQGCGPTQCNWFASWTSLVGSDPCFLSGINVTISYYLGSLYLGVAGGMAGWSGVMPSVNTGTSTGSPQIDCMNVDETLSRSSLTAFCGTTGTTVRVQSP